MHSPLAGRAVVCLVLFAYLTCTVPAPLLVLDGLSEEELADNGNGDGFRFRFVVCVCTTVQAGALYAVTRQSRLPLYVGWQMANACSPHWMTEKYCLPQKPGWLVSRSTRLAHSWKQTMAERIRAWNEGAASFQACKLAF